MTFERMFSKDVYHARVQRGWKQPYVANILSISLREYQNIEYGPVTPHLKTFLRLVYLFELNIDDYREVLGIHDPVHPC